MLFVDVAWVIALPSVKHIVHVAGRRGLERW